jgi:phage terminase small subunit
MGLTAKQEGFCLAYLETGNASEAYRRAYDAENMKPETVNKRASELLDNGVIAGRLAELRGPVVKAAQMTLEAHLEALKALRDRAAEAGQYGAAITAETNRGKAAGLYTERHELTGANGGPVETVNRIELVALD